jgi:hypothetical protein
MTLAASEREYPAARKFISIPSLDPAWLVSKIVGTREANPGGFEKKFGPSPALPEGLQDTETFLISLFDGTTACGRKYSWPEDGRACGGGR